ncbi:MAG: sigma 54-interacting transcriptional regulator [Deltaproteobacteria bacterium]|nr:sigma 54-interacting transcriptional regulator [Deltaproteobacteria bacterium]
MTDSLPVLISYIDADERFEFNNAAHEKWFGRSCESITGQSLRDVLGGKAYDSIREYTIAVLSGREVTFETRIPYPDGRSRHVRGNFLPHRGSDGAVHGFYALVSDISDLKSTERVLDERLRFEALVSRISAQLIHLPTGEIDKVIENGLSLIGGFFDVDRVVIGEFLPDVKGFRARYLWLANRDTSGLYMPSGRRPLPFPNLISRLQTDGAFVFGSLREIPEDWTDVRSFVEKFGLKAAVLVSLSVGGAFMGGFTIESYRDERTWPDDVVRRLKFIGEIFAGAMDRKRSEETLQAAFSEIQRLKERLETENIYLRQEIKLKHNYEEIVGQSTVIKAVLNQVEQVAETDSTVLIQGETGTGKELLARAIHNFSSRKGRTMVKVNCAALPAALVESELFGREKGAYTGALSKQMGRFEVAHGSTIFLDEISELPLELQAKLLRVLQDGRFERLGSSKTIHVDVRVIAATNRDLVRAVKDGRFRQDLYYRLNVFPITVPPLRERPEDIPLLVWAFINEFGETMGKRIESIPKQSMELMQRCPWPGNVRELRNVIEHGMIITRDKILKVQVPGLSDSVGAHDLTIREVERKHVVSVLERTGWRIRGRNGAAAVLGLKPTTLHSRMKKLGIQRPGKSFDISLDSRHIVE